MKFSILLIVFISLMLFSCLGDETETKPIVEDETGWIKHPFYQHDFKAMRGVFELDNHILTLHDFGYGAKTYHKLEDSVEAVFLNLNVAHYPGKLHKHSDRSFPINEKYLPVSFVELPNTIFVYSLTKPMNPVTAMGGLEIKGEDIDPEFRQFSTLGSSRGNTISLNEDYLFLAYEVKNNNARPLKFALIELKENTEGIGVGVEVVSIQTIDAPQREDLVGNQFLSVISVNDGFIVTTFFSLFKWRFDGTIKEFERDPIDRDGFERYTTSFLINDPNTNVILCAETSTFLDSYYSTDNGETWDILRNFVSNVDFVTLDILNFYNFKGNLYGTYNSQIFQISISPNQLIVNELDNSGLVGNKITGISSYHKDSLVMVSTRSGAFYKPSADFLKPKINDSMGLFSGGF
ncbi:hypothetical protein [Belliella pelovolcani]|nr:hypothetical protein [Belliella pelovolcani]